MGHQLVKIIPKGDEDAYLQIDSDSISRKKKYSSGESNGFTISLSLEIKPNSPSQNPTTKFLASFLFHQFKIKKKSLRVIFLFDI